MKMDVQHRIRIPEWIRHLMKVEKSNLLYVSIHDGNIFSLSKECEGKAFAQVKIDDKGRFYSPELMRNRLRGSELILYYENKKVWVQAD